MDSKKDLPKRKDIRLKNYDYSSPGAYFVTICTDNRKNYFWNGSIDPQKFNWRSVGANCVSRATWFTNCEGTWFTICDQ